MPFTGGSVMDRKQKFVQLALAVEVIPDIFRTIGNVTADLAAARFVEGGDSVAE